MTKQSELLPIFEAAERSRFGIRITTESSSRMIDRLQAFKKVYPSFRHLIVTCSLDTPATEVWLVKPTPGEPNAQE